MFAIFENRVTAVESCHDIHWVVRDNEFIPASLTDFACDPVFGYQTSYLPGWVEEQTEGVIKATEVWTIGLDRIRKGGPGSVLDLLLETRDRRIVIVNAVEYRDLEVVVKAILEAEQKGERFIFRTAASFVKAFSGITDRELLDDRQLVNPIHKKPSREPPPENIYFGCTQSLAAR